MTYPHPGSGQTYIRKYYARQMAVDLNLRGRAKESFMEPISAWDWIKHEDKGVSRRYLTIKSLTELKEVLRRLHTPVRKCLTRKRSSANEAEHMARKREVFLFIHNTPHVLVLVYVFEHKYWVLYPFRLVGGVWREVVYEGYRTGPSNTLEYMPMAAMTIEFVKQALTHTMPSCVIHPNDKGN